MKNKKTPETEYSAIALGNFDGLHAGHRAVLRKAYNYSLDRNVRAVALIFDVHPKTFFGKKIRLLQTNEEKITEIEKIGLETEVLSFDEYKSQRKE